MESYRQLLRHLKESIDPNNIMNPGVIPFIETDD
jgi:FAD/FMN-containing dehydrogenase